MPTNPLARYGHPPDVLAGFHADRPDADVPELVHIGEQWASRRLFIPSHSHAVWEFYLQISGESRWDAPGATYTLTPGAFFAAPPYVPHRMHERPDDKHHFFFAAIDLPAVCARLPALAPAWHQGGSIFRPRGETLTAPFRQLIREVSLALPHQTAGIRLALDALVLEAARLAETPAPGETHSLTLRHPAVLRAKELLDHQPERPWRLPDLAHLAGVSAHHLVECFTREVGVSPHRYLLAVRVRLAQEMLTGSDIAVTDLALELGFSSSQHFAATFKRLTGETAQGYRAQMRGQENKISAGG